VVCGPARTPPHRLLRRTRGSTHGEMKAMTLAKEAVCKVPLWCTYGRAALSCS
jgi:hypothetical protein